MPEGGGPQLPQLEHEILHMGANDERIWAVSYNTRNDGDTKYAYVIGNPYAKVLQGIEMLTIADLARIGPAGSPARRLTATPVDERTYGIGGNELLPGWRRVSFRLDDIREQLLVANPSLIEGLSIEFAAVKVRSYELAVQAGGRLQPTGSMSEPATIHRLLSLLGAPAWMRPLAQQSIIEALADKCVGDMRALDPLEMSLQPFPYKWWLALAGTQAKRSREDAHQQIVVIKNEAHAKELLGARPACTRACTRARLHARTRHEHQPS